MKCPYKTKGVKEPSCFALLGRCVTVTHCRVVIVFFTYIYYSYGWY